MKYWDIIITAFLCYFYISLISNVLLFCMISAHNTTLCLFPTILVSRQILPVEDTVVYLSTNRGVLHPLFCSLFSL